MFRTRVLVGGLLAGLMLAALFVDDQLAPWFPLLGMLHLALGLFGAIELLGLIPQHRRPAAWIVIAGVVCVMIANWTRPLQQAFLPSLPVVDPWHVILAIIALTAIVAFLWEMTKFDESGEAVVRIAYSVFSVVYLAVLASFLAQLRWLPRVEGDSLRATHALMLTVFVPKCCDIGAYCTGRIIGRHRMAPRLSPKKTWEGAIGGLVFAVVTAIFGASLGVRPSWWIAKATGFGITVGISGMLGDLAESLIKREGQKKDASTVVPGFGGILDVIDSLLFAAPAAYAWFKIDAISPL